METIFTHEQITECRFGGIQNIVNFNAGLEI